MKVVALISGGKDSTYNMMQCIAAGHEIVALANLSPQIKAEMDSYMYQSVGSEAIHLIAEAMELRLFRKETQGVAIQKGKNYEITETDEVEDLYDLLKEVKDTLYIEAVSVGAILSDYQRIRVEHVCSRLNLIPLAYLWRRDQKELLKEMIKCEVDAVLIKVACLGLEPEKHLGRTLSSLQPHLLAMHEKYGLNVCGEGGEYETLTLDCPLFKSRLIIIDSELVMHSDDPFAPVGYLKLNKIGLQTKLPVLSLEDRLLGLPLLDSNGYVTDQGEDVIDLKEDEIDADGAILCTQTVSPKLSTIEPCLNFGKSEFGWLHIGGLSSKNQNTVEAVEEIMLKLKYVLAENQQTLKNIVSITLYTADMKDFSEINRIYMKHINFSDPPCRACVQVPLDRNVPIILEAVSWKLSENVPSDPITERSTMHVQSRSHWAPSNIGPYSQAVYVGEFIYLAGQIGMVPGNLELPQGGVKSQCKLSLRHVERLLNAINSNINLRDVVQGVCYITDLSYISQVRKMWEENTNNAIVNYVVVTGLPKNAQVEWHVWAHRFNNSFEYEETGKCFDSWSVLIYRRWNYENNVAAIVGCLENNDVEKSVDLNVFMEFINYALLEKLNQRHEEGVTCIIKVTIFYSVFKCSEKISEFSKYLNDLRSSENLIFNFVPVLYCKSENTFLSMSGMRSN